MLSISVHYGDKESESTSPSKVDHCDLRVCQYVACLYQNNWFVNTVNNISVPSGDAEVNFMYPKGPPHFFKWPQWEYICLVPFEHIFGILDPPNSSQCDELINNSEMVSVTSNVEKLIQR